MKKLLVLLILFSTSIFSRDLYNGDGHYLIFNRQGDRKNSYGVLLTYHKHHERNRVYLWEASSLCGNDLTVFYEVLEGVDAQTGNYMPGFFYDTYYFNCDDFINKLYAFEKFEYTWD